MSESIDSVSLITDTHLVSSHQIEELLIYAYPCEIVDELNDDSLKQSESTEIEILVDKLTERKSVEKRKRKSLTGIARCDCLNCAI